jgi:hypothetical protein
VCAPSKFVGLACVPALVSETAKPCIQAHATEQRGCTVENAAHERPRWPQRNADAMKCDDARF